jgi:hypothetical protein
MKAEDFVFGASVRCVRAVLAFDVTPGITGTVIDVSEYDLEWVGCPLAKIYIHQHVPCLDKWWNTLYVWRTIDDTVVGAIEIAQAGLGSSVPVLRRPPAT